MEPWGTLDRTWMKLSPVLSAIMAWCKSLRMPCLLPDIVIIVLTIVIV